MPAPLPDETETVKWRIRSADLEILRLLYPGKVNTLARDIITEYVDRVRARMAGMESLQDQ